jgi:hypothetical protein
MWINQPSTLQPFHALDGAEVLVVDEGYPEVLVYFLKGPRISQLVPRLSLSPGWPSETEPDCQAGPTCNCRRPKS